MSGRADVILDKEEGTPGALAIVDDKTRAAPERDALHELQFAVYAAAARGEGFNVRACYLHDLSKDRGTARQAVATNETRLEAAKKTVAGLASGIRRRNFEANAGFDRSVLNACCAVSGLEPPSLGFTCSVRLAKQTWGLKMASLPEVCKFLGIPLDHHKALSDAEACARIVLAADAAR